MRTLFKRMMWIVILLLIIEGVFLVNQMKNKNFHSQFAGQGEIINDNPLLLVNYQNKLDREYIPSDLQMPDIRFTEDISKEEKHVADIVVQPLEALMGAAEADGIILLGNSGYRSYQSQREIYQARVQAEGRAAANQYVAKPGASEHQTGLCIDITNEERYFVKWTEEAEWLAENSYRFGFIIRYPEGKEGITGIQYEPWHIRYVGVEAAEEIYYNQMTLEEYLLN